jgi:putative inorganic carbon (HCO3(-)) transporter
MQNHEKINIFSGNTSKNIEIFLKLASLPLLALFFLFLLKLSPTIQFLIVTVLLVFSLLVFFKKTKIFIFGLLIFTLILNIDKTFYLNHNHTGGVQGLVVSAWDILLILLYLSWAFEIFTANSYHIKFYRQIFTPLLILLVISILSLINASEVNLGLFQILQLLKVYLLFFFIFNFVNSKQRYKTVLLALFFALIIELCIGSIQYYINEYIDLGIFSDARPTRFRQLGADSFVGVTGTTSTVHIFSSYLVMLLPIFFSAYIAEDRSSRKIIYLPVLIGGVILLIFTFSRSGWIGFVVMALCYLFLAGLFSENRFKTILMSSLLAVIIVVLISIFWEPIFLRITGDDHGAAFSRIPMMIIALEIIKSNPIIGIGINNYIHVAPFYDPTGLTYTYLQPVHNVFLQLTAEVGIIGLLAFFWFLWKIFKMGITTIKITDKYFKYQLIGILSGISGLLIMFTANNSTIATDSFVIFWPLAGLIVAINSITQTSLDKGI